MNENILEVINLRKYFPIRGGFFKRIQGYVYAVDGVDLFLKKGETLGLVGESGCGKSTVARTILRLIEPTGGQIFLEGQNICDLRPQEMRSLRKEIQIIFQDPFASLNPRTRVSQIVGQSLEVHGIASGGEKDRIVASLLEKVGLDPADMNRYPHAFSGGQRQRIGIARALALQPKVVIGDEPVSALDVSIRAQVLNLLESLKKEFDLSLMIISHDLSVIQYISDRVGVMYLGKIVEMAESADLYAEAFHPYSRALLSAAPVPDPDRRREKILLEGDVPSPINPPSGCHFHTRCPECRAICRSEEPEMREMKPGHFVACHVA